MLYTCLRKKICKGKSFNSFHKEKRKNISKTTGNNMLIHVSIRVAVEHIIAVVRKIRL